MELVLIDGNSLLNRAFYATPMLTNAKGEFTNAVYGFVNMLLKIIEGKPDYIMVAFDRRAPTFRHKMYDGYKATRKGMPDELASQLPILKEVLSLMDIKMLEQDGIEADDILGTVAKKFDLPTVIYTGDKDALQLVDESTSVYLTRRGITDLVKVTSENIEELFGYSAQGVVEFKSLRGDSSDNIPGVKGIGEKGALDLLGKYGTLDNLYAHLDEIPGKLHEKLVLGREMAYLSHTLATIDTHCDLEIALEDMTYEMPFSQKLFEKFRELEFKTFLKRDIYRKDEPVVSRREFDLVRIDTREALSALISRIDRDYAFLSAANVHLAFEADTEYEIVIAESLLLEGLDYVEVISALSQVPHRAIVYDKKTLMHQWKALGVCLPVCEDVMIKKYVAEGSAKNESAAHIFDMGQAPALEMLEYSAALESSILQNEQQFLYRDVELPLADILYDMEECGFRIDGEKLAELGRRYETELASLTEEITSLAGHSFNINSTKQLREVLFEELGLRGAKKTKTGYSTDIDVLDDLEGFHPIITPLKRFRQLFKLNSTYIEGLKSVADSNWVVHTQFRQTLTSTGRLSSTEPNLQNIPVRDDEGREIRKIFIPSRPENVIVSADYSQIELRLLAAFSGDETLVDAFRSGTDIHAVTASQVFGVPLSEMTPEVRRRAKAVNFGIIYGISDFGLARQIGTPVRAAKEIIERYFATYPKVREFMDNNVAFAKEKGYGITKCNRIRKFPELFSPNYNVRSFGERAAMNMPLQGTAADIIKIAMNAVAREFESRGLRSKLILQVHDELIVDALREEREVVESVLTECMQNAFLLDVPLVVNVSSGENWYEAK